MLLIIYVNVHQDQSHKLSWSRLVDILEHETFKLKAFKISWAMLHLMELENESSVKSSLTGNDCLMFTGITPRQARRECPAINGEYDDST